MNKPHIVITGSSLNALGVLRSLHKYPVSLLSDNKKSPAWFSRYGSKTFVESTKSEKIVSELINYAKKNNCHPKTHILIMTEEKTVFEVSRCRDQLKDYYQLNLCEHELIVKLQSKKEFQNIAEFYKFPVPKANIITTSTDIRSIRDLEFPCVFKPLEQNPEYSKKFKKAYKVNSLDEVATLYSEIKLCCPEMILQEWLEGPDSNIYFCLAYCDTFGNVISHFTGRKIRSWPIQVGGTASCTSAFDSDHELLALTQSFTKNISYQGLIGIEYKFDVIRNKFYMIEPTVGRTDYQHEIAALSGCNYLEQMITHFGGLQSQKFVAKNGILWFDEIADANAALAEPNQLPVKVCKKVPALRRLSDPMPWLQSIAQRFFNKMRAD